ncbi:class II aldolase/adducin family protein [Acetobacter tropicalis]|uniref:Aldolase n=1 Tax=Acetobacter tropicalis TaxID=104102 RepID=A0A095B6H5_9PROT|nr:class II aldolase/adducin family protein [Acetobacter tropicalis]KAA8385979.1 class II aldolase/adducin family protein [Acetobacter tropicalis]KAA8387463.1 class II aldolase/adducin family protein [Acetobacter tropicalis]KGB24568.1 Ribulose-5-phosphate 4-epimerase and related epimerase and aldolase [Acetobacter tropicalis]KXV56094.1 aldolase [Acetobacter tropicalis]MBC9008900.1 class II aldolase/adducin family protein [Acetobacter tropicalis]
MSLASAAPTEQALREELAAAYRLMALFNMTDLVYTHLSVRLPGESHRYLVNPYGLLFEEITASSLVIVDADGQPRQETSWPVNPAGFVIHSAIHRSRPDAACVMHSHTVAGMVVAAQDQKILPLNQMNIEFYGAVGFHGYEGIAADDNLSERERLVRDLGNHCGLILQNHGLLTVGATVAQAFYRMYYMEQACRIQIAAQATGMPLHIPSEEKILRTKKQFDDDPDQGQLIWQALRRKLDREQPDYKN